jgi:hypothetical protein
MKDPVTRLTEALVATAERVERAVPDPLRRVRCSCGSVLQDTDDPREPIVLPRTCPVCWEMDHIGQR